ncbi:putative spermidine/putrescine transport system permease protein [Rhodoligotrophos appendicifer]|uniref:ABC transporter permease n=1 Tax=Rhodoligotrophos appendicifer TaxID=987056 RepID=UPI0011866868|nr:ABC transporter permease [Rhodoligotrophos appendicifer]
MKANRANESGPFAAAKNVRIMDPFRVPWERFLWPAALLSLLLLALPQIGFVWLSFHDDLGLGSVSDNFSLQNYRAILTDSFYLKSIWLTFYLSVGTVIVGTLIGLPTAYALARMPRWLATLLLGLILTTSLITVVIKLMGLNIILGPSGIVNFLLLGMGVISSPILLINNEQGVLIGLVQYTLPIFIMMLFSVMQTIPLDLEEAAEIHGASRFSLWRRIIVPLCMPGLIGGSLIIFNMSMGAFTSAVLLGGGRVRTIPVLIQQKLVQSTEYGMGSALATTLMVFVFGINIAVGMLIGRGLRRAA